MLLFYFILFLSSCYKVVTHNLLRNYWILQDDNKLLDTNIIYTWVHDIKTEKKTCNKSVELNNLVESRQQAVDNLSTSWEQAVWTCTHPVDKLLEQHCYKSAVGLLQLVKLVRFYVPTDLF
jgi:hypothetical protein